MIEAGLDEPTPEPGAALRLDDGDAPQLPGRLSVAVDHVHVAEPNAVTTSGMASRSTGPR